MQYVVYKKATGEVVVTGTAQTEEDANAHASDELAVFFGSASLDSRIVNGEVVPIDKTAQQLADEQWVAIRRIRDERLLRCDWVVTKSSETGAAIPAEWSAYRQALRDITAQPDPFSITWPTPPQRSS